MLIEPNKMAAGLFLGVFTGAYTCIVCVSWR